MLYSNRSAAYLKENERGKVRGGEGGAFDGCCVFLGGYLRLIPAAR